MRRASSRFQPGQEGQANRLLLTWRTAARIPDTPGRKRDGTTASAVALATFQPGVVLHANDLIVV